MNSNGINQILDKFIPPIKGESTVEVIFDSTDSSVYLIKTAKKSYLLAEADFIESDDTYETIAAKTGLKVISKIPVMEQFALQPFPHNLHRAVKIYRSNQNPREERRYVYGTSETILRYKLFEVRPR